MKQKTKKRIKHPYKLGAGMMLAFFAGAACIYFEFVMPNIWMHISGYILFIIAGLIICSIAKTEEYKK